MILLYTYISVFNLQFSNSQVHHTQKMQEKCHIQQESLTNWVVAYRYPRDSLTNMWVLVESYTRVCEVVPAGLQSDLSSQC